MLTIVVVFPVVLAIIAGLLVRGLSANRRQRRLVHQRRIVIAQVELRAEQRLHQLTQDAVARMLEAARRR